MAATFDTTSYSLLFGLVLATVVSVSAADICTIRRNSWLNYDYTYCRYGCCGVSPNEYCCSYSVGVIVGACFGAVALISIIIVLVCCCIRRRAYHGSVLTSQTQNPMIVCSTNQSAQYPAPYPPGTYAPPPTGAQFPPPQPPAYAPPQEGYAYSNFGYQPQPANDPFSTAAYAKPI